MKYGILTFHNIPNFGAMLQAYALCDKIRKLGQDCEIINYKCENIVKRELSFHRNKNIIKSCILYFLIWPKNRKKITECQNFMRQQNLYNSIEYERTNFLETIDKYDVFISGSDMVWNLDITEHDWTYFLDFVPDNKLKFSFSSSIGGTWKEGDLEHIKHLLKRFRLLSTRETDSCEYIKISLGIDCKQTPDPTFLLTTKEWMTFVKKPTIQNYVLVYFPYPKVLSAAKEYAKKNGEKVIVINNNLPIRGVKNVALFSPVEWLGYIANADAVFTDSFHGLLFALYFEKKVWTANHGNRITSLLRQLELENCFIENDTMFHYRIDYERCRRAIEEIRYSGISYLRTMLSIN